MAMRRADYGRIVLQIMYYCRRYLPSRHKKTFEILRGVENLRSGQPDSVAPRTLLKGRRIDAF